MVESKKKKKKKRRQEELPIHGGKRGIWEEVEKEVGKNASYREKIQEYKKQILEKHPELVSSAEKPKKKLSKEKKEELEELEMYSLERKVVKGDAKKELQRNPELSPTEALENVGGPRASLSAPVLQAREDIMQDKEVIKELEEVKKKAQEEKKEKTEEEKVLEEQAQIRRNIEKEVKAKIKKWPETDIERAISKAAHTQKKGMGRVAARKTLLNDEEFKKELEKIKEEAKKEKEQK